MRMQQLFERFLFFGLAACAMLGATGIKRAPAAIEVAKYTLSDHRDGGAAPPTYILRLDGLTSRDANDEFTFSVNSPSIPNSAKADVGVSLWYSFDDITLDPVSIRIFGTVYGGRDTGSDWGGGVAGLWDLDFTYSKNISATAHVPGPGRDDLEVTDDDPANTGTISPRFAITDGTYSLAAGGTIGLNDFTGNHSYSFRFNDFEGHRLGTGGTDAPEEGLFVGYGWLNHGNSTEHLAAHLKASDWLFEATLPPGGGGQGSIPEPTTFAIWSLLAAVGLLAHDHRR